MIEKCAICLDNINNKNIYRTSCNQCFHLLCFLKWLFYQKRCPLCNELISIDNFDNISFKKIYYYQRFDNINIRINLMKMKINDYYYYVSFDDSKVYFTIFTNLNHLDYLEEIGTYDWISKKIIYKYCVKRYETKNNCYLISLEGDVFDYRTHILLKKYNTTDIVSIINDLNNNNIVFSNDHNVFISEECNDSEDFVIKGYYYFKGRAYTKENNIIVPLNNALLGIHE